MNQIQKRGIQKAIEECLLRATALNLKKTGKSDLNNRIYQPFYGISKNEEMNTEKVSLSTDPFWDTPFKYVIPALGRFVVDI